MSQVNKRRNRIVASHNEKIGKGQNAPTPPRTRTSSHATCHHPPARPPTQHTCADAHVTTHTPKRRPACMHDACTPTLGTGGGSGGCPGPAADPAPGCVRTRVARCSAARASGARQPALRRCAVPAGTWSRGPLPTGARRVGQDREDPSQWLEPHRCLPTPSLERGHVHLHRNQQLTPVTLWSLRPAGSKKKAQNQWFCQLLKNNSAHSFSRAFSKPYPLNLPFFSF